MKWADFGIVDATRSNPDADYQDLWMISQPSRYNNDSVMHFPRSLVIELLKKGKTFVRIDGTHKDWVKLENVVLSFKGKIVIEGSNSGVDYLGDIPEMWDEEV